MDGLARDGMTMMCVAHEMGFARRVANRIVFMDGGEILEDCPAAAFFRIPGLNGRGISWERSSGTDLRRLICPKCDQQANETGRP